MQGCSTTHIICSLLRNIPDQLRLDHCHDIACGRVAYQEAPQVLYVPLGLYISRACDLANTLAVICLTFIVKIFLSGVRRVCTVKPQALLSGCLGIRGCP